jgi:hypothetical protein
VTGAIGVGTTSAYRERPSNALDCNDDAHKTGVSVDC